MYLHRAENRFFHQVREAGEKGVKWTPRNSVKAARLIRWGLIECRMDPIDETENGRRTGIRYVASRNGCGESAWYVL